MTEIEKLEKNRTILRNSVTKLISNIDTDTILKNDVVDLEYLEETFYMLSIKSFNLDNVYSKIEPLLNFDEYESEMIETTASLTIFSLFPSKIRNLSKKFYLKNI